VRGNTENAKSILSRIWKYHLQNFTDFKQRGYMKELE
jgi:hypothetical protein